MRSLSLTQQRPSLRGFTLLEMIITVALVGLLVAWGTPNFNEFLQNRRIENHAQRLQSTFSVARSEALTRLVTVNVCWNRTAAPVTINTFDIPPNGIAVLVPPVAAAPPLPARPVEVIRNITFADDNINVLIVDNDTADDCVSFDPAGRLILASVTAGNLTMGVCRGANRPRRSRIMLINTAGRAVVRDNEQNGNPAIINCI